MSVTEQVNVCAVEGCGKAWPDHTFELTLEHYSTNDPFGQPVEGVEEAIRTLYLMAATSRRCAIETEQLHGEHDPLSRSAWAYARGVRAALAAVSGIDSDVLEAVVL